MSQKTIFTITTMTALPPQTADDPSPHYRCVGWFSSADDARKAVERNLGDIWEQIYDYAVVETVHEGLYQTDVDYELYRFDIPSMGYVRIETPEHMRHTCSFGIG